MYRNPLVRYDGTISSTLASVHNLFFKKKITTFAGLYSGIFIMYLQYQASRKETDNHIISYALCVLYVLCVAMVSADIAAFVIRDVSNNAHIFFLYNFELLI